MNTVVPPDPPSKYLLPPNTAADFKSQIGFLKVMLPPNTAVSEYRQFFASPKNGGKISYLRMTGSSCELDQTAYEEIVNNKKRHSKKHCTFINKVLGKARRALKFPISCYLKSWKLDI